MDMLDREWFERGFEPRPRHRRPSEQWVCFNCRKCFKKPSRWIGAVGDQPRSVPMYNCPECKRSMVWVGNYFKAPRKADLRAWLAVQEAMAKWEQGEQRRLFLNNEKLRKK